MNIDDDSNNLTIGHILRSTTDDEVAKRLNKSLNDLLPSFVFENTGDNCLAGNLMNTIHQKVDKFNTENTQYFLKIITKNTLDNINIPPNMKPILYIELYKKDDNTFVKNFKILYTPTFVEYDPNNPNGGNKKPKHYKSRRGSKRTKRKNTRKYRMK